MSLSLFEVLMLINNSELNFAEFKEFFPKINWLKLPRKLGVNHTEFFYKGTYEDDSIRIDITVRPSKIMAVAETFKKRMPNDGSIPIEGYRGQVVEWGSSVEIKVSDTFILDIEAVAGSFVNKATKVLEW